MTSSLFGRTSRPVIVGVAVLLGAAASLPAQARAKTPPPVKIQTSLFRFCSAAETTCLPGRDDSFTSTVRVGTRVTWTYDDPGCDLLPVCPGHDVVFVKGGGRTTPVKKDGAVIYSMVFKKRGTFAYFCGPHRAYGMTGTVVVR